MLPRARAWIIWGGLILLAVVILVRAWFLQVRDSENTLQRAPWIMEDEITLHVPRGVIRDRFGVPIAESVEAYNVIFDPRAFYMTNPAKAEEMAQILRQFPAFDAEKFLSYGQELNDKIPRYQMLARNISPSQIEGFRRDIVALGAHNSVRIEKVFQRVYPLHTLAGGLIGFVDRDGTEGRSGLERGLNEELTGTPVKYRVLRDSSRSPYLLDDVPDVHASRGMDVELTLDVRLQRATEEILQRTLERYRAEEAMAIVSDVKTGDLLAVAALPTIDPNRPFASDESLIWSSHAVGHAHEPGSTAKILTFAAALDSGAIRYDTLLDCEQGRTVINGRMIRDTHAEGIVPAWKAFQVSSNVCAWKMAQALGTERHRAYLQAFGIGKAPSLPINGMTGGILPALRWIDVQHANIAFGYAFSASILQMHLALAAIANGGQGAVPRIVRSLTSGTGERTENPVQLGERVIRAETARLMTRALDEVINGEGGTGWRGAIPGVRAVGKTGTARTLDPATGKYQNRYLSSFSGFFPMEDPQYAITVWIVRPETALGYYGGEVAAPVFREIGLEVLRLYGGPDATWSATVGDAASSLASNALGVVGSNDLPEVDFIAGEAKMPNLVGMRARASIELLRREGFEVVIYGTGLVAGHQPSAGAAVREGQRIVLQLEESWEAP